jgi:hypothetical protein
MTAFAIGFGLLVLFVWLMFSISKNAGIIHERIDRFLEKARATDDQDELRKLHSELYEFAKKECWHKTFGSRVMEVSGYIQGKLAKKI